SITAEAGAHMLDMAAIIGPDADTLLYHLSKFSFQEVQSIMEKLNAGIFQEAHRHFRRGFWKKAFPVAIDCTDLPFYGKKSTMGIVGGKKKASTHWHSRFIALTIIQKHVRFTVAVLPVLPFDTTVPLLERLIEKAEQFIQLKYIEADRGFFTKEVINFFMQRNYKFLMPAVKNDRIKEKIRAFHAGKIAPSFQYQFKKKHSEKENATFTVFVTKAETQKKNAQKNQKKTKKRQTLFDLYHVFATNKKLQKRSAGALQKVADQYRARWGVETGFKMINCFRIKTTSTNFVIRVFFYLFAVVLYNLWVLYNLLHRHKCQKRYTLPTPRVKMLLLLKALQILDKIGDEKVQKLTGGDSP
ncbi:MAG: transposase, partial [Candidatus Helarchaeota archaeon]